MLITPKISICIPCYEMHGKGVLFLNDLLSSIRGQTYTNYEIIISDHSKTPEIYDFCNLFQQHTNIPIHYHHNQNDVGNSSANINNCLIYVTGDIIKPMFQDDAFVNKDALALIVNSYNAGNKWGGQAFIHINDQNQMYTGAMFKPQVPKFDPEQIKNGENIFGCPSVLYFSSEFKELFDKKLIWLMDCEFYYRLWLHFGDPCLLDTYCIAVRIWNQSVTKEISEETKQLEVKYVEEKFNK